MSMTLYTPLLFHFRFTEYIIYYYYYHYYIFIFAAKHWK